jgi:acyl-coenzyme A thioesterase PaaI-like protein
MPRMDTTDRHRHIDQCFGCGSQNPYALGITLETLPAGAVGRATFDDRHQGAPGLVHGGLLAALLDETMGAVPFGGRVTRVTAEMTVRYRKPTPIGTALVCRATLGEVSDRRFAVGAVITAADGPDDVLAEAEAVYVLLGKRH